MRKRSAGPSRRWAWSPVGVGSRAGWRASSGRWCVPSYRERASSGGWRASSDRGSATVWTVGAVAVLCAVFGAVLSMGQAVVVRHRAAGAADLAALAAADHWSDGGTAACARADRVARAQGARLVRCEVEGQISEVTASSGTGPITAEVRSRAGPAGSSGPTSPVRPIPARLSSDRPSTLTHSAHPAPATRATRPAHLALAPRLDHPADPAHQASAPRPPHPDLAAHPSHSWPDGARRTTRAPTPRRPVSPGPAPVPPAGVP